MTEKNTHYSAYDVMALKDEWDSHTKEIVVKRLGPFPETKFLTEHERNLIKVISMHLTYDNREEIFEWIVSYCDQRLSSPIGEEQRKPHVPPESTLIREGLKAIDVASDALHSKSFLELETTEQFDIIASLQLGAAVRISEWNEVPQKDLFNKLGELIISAYYSHPAVWSEIGYGGPAYPRGYYRIEFGLAEPWEPKKTTVSPSGFGEESDNDGK